MTKPTSLLVLLTSALICASCSAPVAGNSASQAPADQIVRESDELVALRQENNDLRQTQIEANRRIEDLLDRAYDMRGVSSCYMHSNIRDSAIMQRAMGRTLSDVERGAMEVMHLTVVAVHGKSTQAATAELREENRRILRECIDSARYRPSWAADTNPGTEG